MTLVKRNPPHYNFFTSIQGILKPIQFVFHFTLSVIQLYASIEEYENYTAPSVQMMIVLLNTVVAIFHCSLVFSSVYYWIPDSTVNMTECILLVLIVLTYIGTVIGSFYKVETTISVVKMKLELSIMPMTTFSQFLICLQIIIKTLASRRRSRSKSPIFRRNSSFQSRNSALTNNEALRKYNDFAIFPDSENSLPSFDPSGASNVELYPIPGVAAWNSTNYYFDEKGTPIKSCLKSQKGKFHGSTGATVEINENLSGNWHSHEWSTNEKERSENHVGPKKKDLEFTVEERKDYTPLNKYYNRKSYPGSIKVKTSSSNSKNLDLKSVTEAAAGTSENHEGLKENYGKYKDSMEVNKGKENNSRFSLEFVSKGGPEANRNYACNDISHVESRDIKVRDHQDYSEEIEVIKNHKSNLDLKPSKEEAVEVNANNLKDNEVIYCKRSTEVNMAPYTCKTIGNEDELDTLSTTSTLPQKTEGAKKKVVTFYNCEESDDSISDQNSFTTMDLSLQEETLKKLRESLRPLRSNFSLFRKLRFKL